MATIDQLIVWFAIGLVGGTLAARITTWDRRGHGLMRNFVIGLLGAMVGGFLFRVLGLFPGLDRVAISLRDIVSAVIGSLIVLLALWFWRRSKKPPGDSSNVSAPPPATP